MGKRTPGVPVEVKAKPVVIAAMKYDANESAIRIRLIEHLKEVEGGDAAFISEMFIGDFSRRADLIVANGSLAAYEIKSAADDVSRLSGQLETYLRLFERVTVVCAATHLERVLSIVPLSVGVWVVAADGQFETLRRAGVNRMRKEGWLTFLPVDVLRRLLREHKRSAVGIRSDLLKKASSISIAKVKSFVLQYLKSERLTRVEARRVSSVRSAADRITQSERDMEVKRIAAALAGKQLVPIPRAKRRLND